MRGKLFTQDFLGEGIAGTAAWRGLDGGEVERFADAVPRVMDAFPTGGAPNEATTERDLIYPRARIPDRELAPLLDALARREEAGRRRATVAPTAGEIQARTAA